jgi:hypothetical protein
MKNKIVFIVLGGFILIILLITIVLSIFSKKQTSPGSPQQTSIFNNLPFIGSRNTNAPINSNSEAIGNTREEELIQDETNFQKQKHSDIFLSNLTPYESNMFKIYSDYKTEPTGHFYFLVYLDKNDTTTARTQFSTWLKSNGLTDTQIQSLDIQYFEQ